jgi:acyl dehydratase
MGVPVGKILHGSQTFTYHEPVYPGDRITFETKVSDIYDKKGGALEFIVEDTAAKNQEGALVCELQRVIVVRN